MPLSQEESQINTIMVWASSGDTVETTFYDDTNVQYIMASIKNFPVPDARRLILFMHLHKCGGSSCKCSNGTI